LQPAPEWSQPEIPYDTAESYVTDFLDAYLHRAYMYEDRDIAGFTALGAKLDEKWQAEVGEKVITAEQAVKNANYILSKAGYWKEVREIQGIYRKNFEVGYYVTEKTFNGSTAKLTVSCMMHFRYLERDIDSGLENVFTVYLGYVNDRWVVLDMDEVHDWFDAQFKAADVGAIEEAVEAFRKSREEPEAKPYEKYDLNRDGILQTTELPAATPESVGITDSTWARVYSAWTVYLREYSEWKWGTADDRNNMLSLPVIIVYKSSNNGGTTSYYGYFGAVNCYDFGSEPSILPEQFRYMGLKASRTGTNKVALDPDGWYGRLTLDRDGKPVSFDYVGDGEPDPRARMRQVFAPFTDLADTVFEKGRNGVQAEFSSPADISAVWLYVDHFFA